MVKNRAPKSEKPANVTQKAFGRAAEKFGKEIEPLGERVGQVTNLVGTKLINLVEGLVTGLEKIGNWLRDAVAERLKDVPPEKITEPSPRIAVPAVQALVYSMDEELIREMYANLLAAD